MRRARLSILIGFVSAALAGCAGSGGDSGTPIPVTHGKWTVLVYMNAANNLYPDGDLNFHQMEKAAGNSQVRFVVQWKQTQAVYPASSFDGTRRYLVKNDLSASVSSGLVQDLGTGVDMGSPQTLSDFIAWGKKNYPADRYALVIWDHGNGWRTKRGTIANGRAFSYDDQTHNAIQIWDVPTALGGQQFDMMVWDCSLMQMAEVAYQLRGNTGYVVGTEESPPAEGFPYDTALAKFRDLPDAATLELAKSWVDAMLADPSYTGRNIEESVVDTTKLPALSSAVDALAVQLITNNTALTNATKAIRSQGQQYDTTLSPPRYYFDLTDVASRYRAATPDVFVDQACTNAITAVTNAVAYERHNSHSPNSHGISIDFSSSADFNPYLGEYLKLDFGKANRWAQWLTVAP